ncbi:hypothetical protein ZIOFF_017256 [Zingiber officinale]|uniref:Uncharacterized protein n=1 Tax=Zingiber officinale TaxID=94328 RepID=A0A8J5HJ54_ZINOF|nr:hypothetical protein ZIOFF_017256 [Zingiber officinale]
MSGYHIACNRKATKQPGLFGLVATVNYKIDQQPYQNVFYNAQSTAAAPSRKILMADNASETSGISANPMSSSRQGFQTRTKVVELVTTSSCDFCAAQA